MVRRLVMVMCAVGLAGGCTQSRWAMEPPQKPGVAPQMAQLQRLIGNWSGHAEMVEPSREAMLAMMPENERHEMPEKYAGGGSWEWALGGMALRGDGWYEMGPGQKVNYVEFWTWDAKNNRFRTWFASDWGETGEGWAKFNPDGNSMTMNATMRDADGTGKSGSGTFTFLDNNTMEWTYAEKGSHGNMRLRGVSKRQP